MSYKFTCLGKNKNGKRCKNRFLTSKWSNVLTCSKHRDQKVFFEYTSPPTFSFPKDVAGLIAKNISDPKTFSSFAKVCISSAKACSFLQESKKNEYSKEVPKEVRTEIFIFTTDFYNGGYKTIKKNVLIKVLPNGDPL